MNKSETQVLVSDAVDDAKVIEYLLQHPDFFTRHGQLIEQIHIPHSVRGAISLVEWQLERQRRRIHQLLEERSFFVARANANEALFAQLLALQGHLLNAVSLRDLQQRLQSWACSIGLLGTEIRLFSDKWRLGPPSDYVHWAIERRDFEWLRIQRFGQQNHYLGRLNQQELSLLLPQDKQVGSVALSLIGEQGELGVLIFTSRDRQHYQAGMGLALLEKVSALLPGMLSCWIERQ